MSNSLLPYSATPFMRRTETATARINDIPVNLRQLWDPNTCPAGLLPYLAWALSVDRWDKDWSEQTKRDVIKAAFIVHRKKGTISALRRVVEPFGYLLRVTEWWQIGGEPGTFSLDISIQEQGITEETYLELERLISDAKPCSRHMLAMSINLQSQGKLNAGVGCYTGETLTVYPYMPETIEVGGTPWAGAAIHTIDTMRVQNGG
ncbi:phage tail protein I [Citrobacter freundii]|uniref:phage tail protein I n=1 Tax=Citrobacter freundii TaxID=546 RepID=UPI00190139C1|nr:phage tail protein I [Citrobacter freundii]MBJ8767892.1 phage tail protein I [Citrobacter freundii]